MKLFTDTLRSILFGTIHILRNISSWYKNRTLFGKIIILGGVFIVLYILLSPASQTETQNATQTGRFVSVRTIQELQNSSGGASMIGTVRAATGADILAKTSGTVVSVQTQIGATVPAGFVIATLENAAERAAVLSAEGAYEAAIANRNSYSVTDTTKAARDAYLAAFTLFDDTVENEMGAFFGDPTAFGPKFLLESAPIDERTQYSRDWALLEERIAAFKSSAQQNAATLPPETLLNDAETIVRALQEFLNRLAGTVNRTGITPTEVQVTALTDARNNTNTLLSLIATARTGLRSGTITATASADAAVKQALGALRGAEANLEQTIVRAPVGGRIDFLPIRVGDYVSSMQHVATVSQSGTLEVVAYVPETERDALTIGGTVTINETQTGVVTAIAPALDPVTKQIEVRIAAQEGSDLIGGQSVRIRIPDAIETGDTLMPETTLLPLSSVKLRATDRVVFSINNEGRLVAHPVTVGDVRGEHIEILSDIPGDLAIVTDARGLAEGELVRVTNAE